MAETKRRRSLDSIAARVSRDAALAAGLISLLLLALPLVSGLVYYGLDLTQIDVGVLCSARRLLEAGEPLWLSPHLGNGNPLLLRPSAQLLYPLRWLLLPLPADYAAALGVILHLALGAAATSWLARTFGARGLSSACAGLAFALSGTCLDLLVHTGSFALGACYLPLVWAAARRGLSPRGGAGHILLVGLGMVALLLGGEPQAWGLASVLLLLELASRAPRWRWRPPRRALLLLCTLPATLAVGALLWIGYFAESTLSFRAGGLAPGEALKWSFDSTAWLSALWPNPSPRDALPHANMQVWRLALLGPHQADTWNASPYLGPLFLVAVVCAGSLRRVRPALLVLSGGLLLAVGSGLPLAKALVEAAPSLALFRYPAKLLLVSQLAAAVAAALFLERLIRSASARRTFAICAGIAILFQGLALTWTLASGAGLDRAWSGLAGQAYYAELPKLSEQLLRSIAQATAPLVLALVLVVLFARLRFVAMLLLLVDLLLAAPGAVQLGPPLAEGRSPVAAALPTERLAAPVVAVNLNAFAVDVAGEGRSGRRQMALRRLFLAPELQACEGLAGAMPYGALWTSMNRLLVAGLFVGDLNAVRALGAGHSVQRSRGGPPSLVAVSDPLPPAFVIVDPRVAPSEVEVARRVMRVDNAAAAVAVLDDPLGRLGRDAQLPTGDGVQLQKLDWPRRDRAQLSLAGSGAAVVGLRTAFLVGWRAQQGEVELPVLRSSGQHVAALVEDVSRGPVRFSYHSPHFGLSVAAAVLGLSALLALAWLGRRQWGGPRRRVN